MKILMVTQWFDPEPCPKGLTFAKALQDQGHEVAVLTGFPNYPSGKIYPGYRQKWRFLEDMEGIKVTRVPLYPSRDRSAARRVVNYLSFALSSLIATLLLSRPDIIYVYSPPPSVALGPIVLKLLRRIPFVIDIQDMWPEALTAPGMISSPALITAIRRTVDFIHRRATRIVVLSDGFRSALIERGMDAARIAVIPNWTNEADGAAAGPEAAASRDTFDIVFAGNMGPAQDLDIVLDAAAALKTSAPHVRFIMVGDGIDAARLVQRARAQALDNVVFAGRLPSHEMPPVLAQADALLVQLRDEPIYAVTIPSKVQAYLRAGRPILIGVRGDAAVLVERAGGGMRFEPGNARALAEAVLFMIALPPETRAEMGRSGARYYREHLSLDVGVRAFLEVFEQARSKDIR